MSSCSQVPRLHVTVLVRVPSCTSSHPCECQQSTVMESLASVNSVDIEAVRSNILNMVTEAERV